MKNLTKQLLYKGNNVARANVVWNIAGSFVYAFASMVLSFLVIRMAGEEKGGIFSFGYSTLGQQLFLVAYLVSGLSRSQTERESIPLRNTESIEI